MKTYSNIDLEEKAPIDYTVYTNNSQLDDSFELNEKTETLLNYHEHLLNGFDSFEKRDSAGQIESYKRALDTLEDNPDLATQETLVSTTVNLGVAHFHNNQIKIGLRYVLEGLDILKSKKALKN